MMDFGYLGSSSNLSALAPPFTLDRSTNKPNSESFLNITDLSPAVPFSSSLPSWQYSISSASNPNCYSDSSADFGVDSIRTTYLASESYYPYFGVSSISSPTTHMSPLNANVSTTPDGFTSPHYSAPIPTNYVEPKPYCHSFVSPVIENDVPSVVLPKYDYNLSSKSQVDYLRSLSGLKYTPHWGSYWDNIDSLADGQMGKQVDYDGSFCSTQIDGSYAYKSYPDQGSSNSIGKESPPVRLDLLGGQSQIVTPVTSEVNSKPFPTQGSSFTRYDPARSLGISMFPISHVNAPLVEAAATNLNHQKPYSSQDQSFQPLNVGKSEYITTKRSSPPVVIRPPPVRLDKKNHFCDSSPSSIRGDLSNIPLTENVEGHLSKSEKELQLPDINAPPYSLNSASDRVKSISSVEGPLESLDGYYPALDSPCWKGVSSFRFSPSEDHEPVASEHTVEKPGPLGALELPQTQCCTPFGADNAQISSQKAPENGYVELGSLLCPDSLPNARNPMKADDSTHEIGVDHTKMSSSNLNPFSNNIEKLTVEFDSSNDSQICSDLKPVQWKKPDFENDHGLGFHVAEAGLDCSSVSSKLDVRKLVETIHNLSKLLLFLCSDDASALSEVRCESLKLAMKNLDACVSKMVPNLTQEPNLHKNGISGRPPLPKEVSSCLSFNNHRSEQEIENIELSKKEVKKFSDLFSAKVDEDFEKDGKVTRAIKIVLEENFGANEDMQPEAVLYKNLWLEAEAALCSVSFRARYNRMKTKMDKYKLPPKIEEPMKTFEELYNEVFPDPSSHQKDNPIIETFKMFHKSNLDPSASRKTVAVDEAETSFRARLDILNNRVSNQNFAYAGEQTDEEVDAAFAETIKTVEKLLSSDDSEDCAVTKLTQKGPSHAIERVIPGSSFYAPSPCTSKTVGNVEASVMARLQILKGRGVSAISEKPGQKSESVVKDFHVRTSGDLANQIGGSKTQISSGWGDGSLSDWEDVLKDEFACRK